MQTHSHRYCSCTEPSCPAYTGSVPCLFQPGAAEGTTAAGPFSALIEAVELMLVDMEDRDETRYHSVDPAEDGKVCNDIRRVYAALHKARQYYQQIIESLIADLDKIIETLLLDIAHYVAPYENALRYNNVFVALSKVARSDDVSALLLPAYCLHWQLVHIFPDEELHPLSKAFLDALREQGIPIERVL